jgi:hypothetical protein
MTSLTSDSDADAAQVKPSWFTRPLAGWACVLGWCLATGIFVAGIVVPGGTAVGDAYLIIYPTWAVSHGQFVCMYPPHPLSVASLAAPVYPLIAGAAGFVTRVGSSASFPTGSALGHNCDKAVVGMVQWSERAGAVFPTLRIGYVAWLFLMVGVIMLLRSAGRGRTGWEPTGVVIVACLPPLWYCIEMYAHPQDVVAMAFGLAAMACALRSQWVAAGVLVMLAILTQQYALLVAIPLFVVAPAARKLPFLIGGALTAAVLALPLVAATSGAAVRPIFLGTGNVGGIGGTIAWEAHIRTGATLFLGSRLPPLVLAVALSWYVVRKLGPSVLQPSVLISLVALSLSFRLVFEDTIFSYYYMPLAVALVVLDVVGGRIRETIVAWVAMVTLVYSEPSIIVWRQLWGQDARRWIPVVVIVVGLLLIVRSVLRHRLGWNTAMWAAAVLTALIFWPVSSDPFTHPPVTWLWQVVLVGIGIALAAGPLVRSLRQPFPGHRADTGKSTGTKVEGLEDPRSDLVEPSTP